MNDELEITGIRVPKDDWQATPASIQMLVQVLSERLLVLEEKVNQNSQNSSKPPSTDGFGQQEKAKTKKAPRASGRASTPREVRKLYPAEACDASMRSSPQPARGVEPAYRGTIVIAIK